MGELRERVLDFIQSGFPLEADPYGVIAAKLDATRDGVLDAVAALRRDGTIRRLGASFASKKLGYSSTLCALAVPGDQDAVDRAAQVVNAYPNITHNYLRTNRYNLWFTIIARSSGEVARILSEIQEKTGCPDALNLPATALYKIKVDFGEMKKGGKRQEAPSDHADVPAVQPTHPAVPFDPDSPFDIALVRWAQSDIAGGGEEVDAEPFATAATWIAAQIGDVSIDEAQVTARLRDWKTQRVIRRFGALVAHRKMGFSFNGMTVWDVPEGRCDEVGRLFADQRFVSHCYARPRSEAWPYNLYGMVHAKTQEELDERVSLLEELAGLPAQVLVSTREYKKSSMRYFEE